MVLGAQSIVGVKHNQNCHQVVTLLQMITLAEQDKGLVVQFGKCVTKLSHDIILQTVNDMSLFWTWTTGISI